jgi:hypothetical protein
MTQVSLADILPFVPDRPDVAPHPHILRLDVGPTSTVALMVPRKRDFGWIREVSGREIAVHVFQALHLLDDRYAGRYLTTSFEVIDMDDVGLTPELIRSLPMAEIAASAEQDPSTGKPTVTSLGATLARLDPVSRDVVAYEPNVKLTDEETVCVTWTVSKLLGRDTNKVLAELLGITSAAAAQRVRRLRSAGLLPRAESQGERR